MEGEGGAIRPSEALRENLPGNLESIERNSDWVGWLRNWVFITLGELGSAKWELYLIIY